MNIDPLKLIQAFWSLLSSRYDRRKHQIDRIESYLNPARIKNPALSPALHKILVAEKEDQIFSDVRGYSLPADLRKKLTPIVLAQNSPVSWNQVKGAQPYLKIEKSKLLVRYKKSDLRKNRLSSLFATICLSGALALWVIVANPGAMTVTHKVIAGFCSILLLGASLLTVSWSVGFDTALKIERWLNRANN